MAPIACPSCNFSGNLSSCLPSRTVSIPRIIPAIDSSWHCSLKTAPQKRLSTIVASTTTTNTSPVASESKSSTDGPIEYIDLHHVGLLCSNLEKSLEFYCGVLGMKINPDRPENKLPYRGAWLWVGPGMIHLMELPNPDPLTGRPEHGGRDRHACMTIKSVDSLRTALDAAGIPYTASKSGRRALFTRDPDSNALEFAEPI